MVKENDKYFDSCDYIRVRWFCPVPYAQKEKRRGQVLRVQLRRKLLRMRKRAGEKIITGRDRRCAGTLRPHISFFQDIDTAPGEEKEEDNRR